MLDSACVKLKFIVIGLLILPLAPMADQTQLSHLTISIVSLHGRALSLKVSADNPWLVERSPDLRAWSPFQRGAAGEHTLVVPTDQAQDYFRLASVGSCDTRSDGDDDDRGKREKEK